jgi:DNA-binding CsgD family transcriptional regulator
VLKGKNISIIASNNFLLCLGLRSVLTEFFSPEGVHIYANFDEYQGKENGNDFVILHAELYITHNEYFQSIKNKLILLTLNENSSFTPQTSPAILNITLSQDEMVERLEKIFLSRSAQNTSDNQEDLSVREIEVLKLVAVGLMNKQIADQLNISLHTVISHRKNITRKLGIKTVSGLTVYALLNGLIYSKDLE